VHRRVKILTIGLAESTEQVDSAVDEAPELSKDLAIDYDIASLDWFVHVEAGEDLTVFEEEEVGLCRDKCGRNVAGEEVLQPLNPGGEVLDVFIQSVGRETGEDLVTDGVEIDSLPLTESGSDGDIGVEGQAKSHEARPRNTAGDTDVQRRLPLRSNTSNRLDLVFAIWQGNLNWADTWVGGCNRRERKGMIEDK